MDIQILKVVDYGTHDSERVILKALAACNLQYYLLTDTTYTDASHISNKLRHMYWFYNQDVKKEDEIFLYTKTGTSKQEALTNGATRFTYYWGLGNSVWNNTGDAALLFQVTSWDTTKVR